MRHLAPLPLIALAFAVPATAQTVPIDTFREAVRTLSSDEYEGRAPGTAGEEKTLAFLVEQFKAA